MCIYQHSIVILSGLLVSYFIFSQNVESWTFFFSLHFSCVSYHHHSHNHCYNHSHFLRLFYQIWWNFALFSLLKSIGLPENLCFSNILIKWNIPILQVPLHPQVPAFLAKYQNVWKSLRTCQLLVLFHFFCPFIFWYFNGFSTIPLPKPEEVSSNKWSVPESNKVMTSLNKL